MKLILLFKILRLKAGADALSDKSSYIFSLTEKLYADTEDPLHQPMIDEP